MQQPITGALTLIPPAPGGVPAFHDARFVEQPTSKECSNCGAVWHQGADEPEIPAEEVVTEADTGMERAYKIRANELRERCLAKGAHVWTQQPEVWSSDGIRLLKDGDYLTIIDPRRIIEGGQPKILWQGTIDLYNHVQRDVPRIEWTGWFTSNHPAVLTVS